jgi:F0F1-type ATP synthase assembly protein I
MGSEMTQQYEPPGVAASSASREAGAGDRRQARADFRSSMSGLDNSSIMGVELMLAIVVWTGIGWLADQWLGTGPVLMILGALIGNFAGLYLIWLRSGRMEDAERRAAAERRRPRVASSPGAAVMDAVVAGRTGIPTSAHTHGIDRPEAHVPIEDAPQPRTDAAGGRLIER